MQFPSRLLIALAVASLFVADARPGLGAPAGGSVAGQITVTKNGKPVAQRANVVVYLEGVPRTAADENLHASIEQKDIQFAPRFAVIVKGTTVDFPNHDKIFHNVFSTSRPARFDLGLYRSGGSKSVVFKREGVVDIFCNIHPDMSSRVLVVPTHHYALTDAQGRYRIDGVPAGTYPAVVWHPNGKETRTTVTVEAGKVTTLNAQVDQGEKQLEHRRKDGSPYGRYE